MEGSRESKKELRHVRTLHLVSVTSDCPAVYVTQNTGEKFGVKKKIIHRGLETGTRTTKASSGYMMKA